MPAAGEEPAETRNEETPHRRIGVGFQGCRRRPTLPRPLGRSTIGAAGLNARVRDGNGCGPCALVASDLSISGKAGDLIARLSSLMRNDRREVEVIVFILNQLSDCANCVVLEIAPAFKPATIKEDQASRAMRIAALGMNCSMSTCDLLTGWSLPALQGAQGSREDSSWGKLPT